MTITSVYRIIRLGFVNFWRNRWLSLAATLMMSITLLIISFFTILNISVNAVSEAIRSRLDLEVYFFNDQIPNEKIFSLANDLKKQQDVAAVDFISKEEAKANFADYELDPAVASQITDDFNPLPRSLRIKVEDAEKIPTIAHFVNQDQYKDIVCQEKKCMSYNYEANRETTNKMLSVTKFVKKAGWAIGSLFVLVSILIILNTIRLTIFTRKDEIEIMKLVGANHAFIRFPFVVEAVLYGFFATLASLSLIMVTVQVISPYINRYLTMINLNMTHFLQQNFWQITGLQLLVGLSISIFCSFFSIRKHLKT